MRLVKIILEIIATAGLLSSLQVLLLSPAMANSGSEPATITKKIGKVTVLSAPSSTRKGKGPHVKFDGLFYHAAKAKKGMVVAMGSVIQTGRIGRARLTFPNGDQITVSKSSFFRIGYDKKSQIKTTQLMFGSIRGMVRTKGGQQKLKVKTKTMVMGVRGTDFFVSARDRSGSSTVNVLRGKVAVAQLKNVPGEAADKKPRRLRMVEIPAGFSVKVKPAPAAGKKRRRSAPLKVKPTTKKQLVAVQMETVIKENPAEEVSPEVAAQVAKLEAKAAETCLHDIKDYNPALYRQIKEQQGDGPATSVDAIQTSTVKSMIKKAPVATDVKSAKPTAKELEAIDQDIYDRYFN